MPVARAVIYPDHRGVIAPQFSCDTPNHLKFRGVFTGGVYVIVMVGVMNNNNMLTM